MQQIIFDEIIKEQEKNKMNFTGYPHKDKPWMKYYTKEQEELVIPNMNISQYIKERNKKNLSNIAEVYYGKEIAYEELFYNIDLSAKVLSQIGVKKGDVVGMLLPNIPEAGQLFLGASEIGAIADFIDPRPDSMDVSANAQKLLEVLKYEKVKYMIVLEQCFLGMIKPIENELKEIGIKDIITVSAEDSMTLSGKIDYLRDVIAYNELKNSRNPVNQLKNYKVLLNKIKSMQQFNNDYKKAVISSTLNIMKYSDLKKECQNSIFKTVNDVNAINYIGHTSGTSGSRPKSITATNKNGIASSIQCEKSGFTPNSGETAFHLLPFFAPAGAYSNYLANLSAGVKIIDVSEFEIQDFGYLIKKYKPNSLLATPAWFALLPDYELLKNEDLSFLKKIVYCGDSETYENKEKLQKWLKNHGSNAIVEDAHGMSEYLGCGSYAHDEYNRPNSIGIPLPNTIYSLVDPRIDDKLVPIKFEVGQEKITGELIVSAPNVTDGILNGDIIVPHYELDGNSYIRTRDIVEMDRDGIFYHKSRKDRSFVRFDGYKVKPYEIEEVIEQNKYVKYARIVGYYEERNKGMMPMCHIVLEDDCLTDDYIHVVNDIIYNTIISNPNMSSRQIPSKFKIRDFMPLTKNNKVDFNSLAKEELDGSEINVDIEETNLNVGDIHIYKDCKILKKK